MRAGVGGCRFESFGRRPGSRAKESQLKLF